MGPHNRYGVSDTTHAEPVLSPSPRLRRNAALSLLALTTCAAPAVRAQSLLGSHESLLKQNEEAREHDFTYLRTSADVRDYVQQGVLVRVRGTRTTSWPPRRCPSRTPGPR